MFTRRASSETEVYPLFTVGLNFYRPPVLLIPYSSWIQTMTFLCVTAENQRLQKDLTYKENMLNGWACEFRLVALEQSTWDETWQEGKGCCSAPVKVVVWGAFLSCGDLRSPQVFLTFSVVLLQTTKMFSVGLDIDGEKITGWLLGKKLLGRAHVSAY